MLPASARVRRRAEFAVALRGSRVRADGLVLHFGTLPAEPLTAGPMSAMAGRRAGVIVSRAVGGAVVRNRVRRQIRHLLPGVLPQLPDDAVLVVRALPSAAGRSSRQLNDALLAGCARLPRVAAT